MSSRTIAALRIRRAPEKAVEAKIDDLCRTAGCVAIRFSQARASRQSPGIPDRRYYHPAPPRLAFWVEAKAPNGRQSPAQRTFQALCDLCGDIYVLGGYREVLEFLIRAELWRLPEGVTIDDVAGPA